MIDETHQYGLNFASRISMADPNLLHRDIASLVHSEMDTYTHYIPALEREFVRLLAVFFRVVQPFLTTLTVFQLRLLWALTFGPS